MQVVQVPVTVQPPQNLAFSDQFLRTRQIILGLTISIVVNYLLIIIPLDVFSYTPLLIYSVPIIAFYNIVECICFYGCKQFSFCLVLTFRIIFLLHDFAYFIPYCIWSSDWYYERGFNIAIVIFLVVAMGLNITIMVFYGKLPRYDSCCCAPPTVVTQGPVQYTTGPIQQPYVIQVGGQAQVTQLPNGQQVIYQPQMGSGQVRSRSLLPILLYRLWNGNTVEPE